MEGAVKMKTGQIFGRTMPFVWLKLLVSLALNSAFVAVILVGVWIAMAAGSVIVFWLIILFFIAGLSIHHFLKKYLTYMLKAAHVAVITELADGGATVANRGLVEYGFDKVKERFVTSNVFFVLDSLVAGAVRQIQNTLTKVASWLSFIPGLQFLTNIFNMFLGVTLNFVDEAVLSHVFRTPKSENAFKGACDGTVLWAQNWKALAKNGAFITLVTYGANLALGAVLFLAFYFPFKTWVPTASIDLVLVVVGVAALILANALVSPFVESFVTVSVIRRYTEVTTGQTPNVDFYGKCKQWSTKFRKMFDQSGQNNESSVATNEATSVAGVGPSIANDNNHDGKLIHTKPVAIINANNPVGMVGGVIGAELMGRGIDKLNEIHAKSKQSSQPAEQDQTVKGENDGQQ